MARVTVEDCVEKVPNRFDLVLMAALRARDLTSGTEPTVPDDHDKNPVIALREIAAATVSPEVLENALIQSMQKHVESDEPEEEAQDVMELLRGETELAGVTQIVPEGEGEGEGESVDEAEEPLALPEVE